MADDAVELVRLRNNFYRDNYRKLLTALLGAFVAIVLLVLMIVYLIMQRPAPVYFAMSANGRIEKLYPLSEPVVTAQSLLQFASEAAMSAYTFNFIDYRKQFMDSKQYFTDEGWNGFLQSLKDSGNLDAVKTRQLIVNAVPGGAPVVVQEGVLNGRYAWRVQMPLLVTYRSSSQTYHNSWMVTLLIERVSSVTYPRGIAISQINFTQEQ